MFIRAFAPRGAVFTFCQGRKARKEYAECAASQSKAGRAA